MTFAPTVEQEKIMKAYARGEDLSVKAGAGAAKTTTLEFMARMKKKKCLLMVFGKDAQRDAESRFPPHVMVRTTHSLAFAGFGAKFSHKLNREKKKAPKDRPINMAYTSMEIAMFFGMKNEKKEEETIQRAMKGMLVKKTVDKYEQSADPIITKHHVPELAFEKGVEKEVLEVANKLWEARLDVKSKAMITHDTYMKLYQLSKPILKYDVIFLDEAQDTSHCTLDIFNRQKHAQRIMVGDEHQSIYGWRGSINAMKFSEGKKEKLTQSFRFGPRTAIIANAILDKEVVVGFDQLDTRVGPCGVIDGNKTYTKLYRGNSALLADAATLIKAGKRVNLEIDTIDFCNCLTSADNLKNGVMKKVKHDLIVPYSSWRELMDETDDNPELKRIAKLVQMKQVGWMNMMLRNHKNTKWPQVIMTTAHKSKGREWPQVVLAQDYPSCFDKKTGDWIGLSEEEQNTLYVACTRGKYALQYNSTVQEILDHYRIEIPE